MEDFTGFVKLIVHGARGMPDNDIFDRIDPYVILKCGNQKLSTTHIEDGGSAVVWGQTLILHKPENRFINGEVYDKNKMSKDQILGTFDIDLEKIYYKDRMEVIKEDYEVQNQENQSAGYVCLTVNLFETANSSEDRTSIMKKLDAYGEQLTRFGESISKIEVASGGGLGLQLAAGGDIQISAIVERLEKVAQELQSKQAQAPASTTGEATTTPDLQSILDEMKSKADTMGEKSHVPEIGQQLIDQLVEKLNTSLTEHPVTAELKAEIQSTIAEFKETALTAVLEGTKAQLEEIMTSIAKITPPSKTGPTPPQSVTGSNANSIKSTPAVSADITTTLANLQQSLLDLHTKLEISNIPQSLIILKEQQDSFEAIIKSLQNKRPTSAIAGSQAGSHSIPANANANADTAILQSSILDLKAQIDSLASKLEASGKLLNPPAPSITSHQQDPTPNNNTDSLEGALNALMAAIDVKAAQTEDTEMLQQAAVIVEDVKRMFQEKRGGDVSVSVLADVSSKIESLEAAVKGMAAGADGAGLASLTASLAEATQQMTDQSVTATAAVTNLKAMVEELQANVSSGTIKVDVSALDEVVTALSEQASKLEALMSNNVVVLESLLQSVEKAVEKSVDKLEKKIEEGKIPGGSTVVGSRAAASNIGGGGGGGSGGSGGGSGGGEGGSGGNGAGDGGNGGGSGGGGGGVVEAEAAGRASAMLVVELVQKALVDQAQVVSELVNLESAAEFTKLSAQLSDQSALTQQIDSALKAMSEQQGEVLAAVRGMDTRPVADVLDAVVGVQTTIDASAGQVGEVKAAVSEQLALVQQLEAAVKSLSQQQKELKDTVEGGLDAKLAGSLEGLQTLISQLKESAAAAANQAATDQAAAKEAMTQLNVSLTAAISEMVAAQKQGNQQQVSDIIAGIDGRLQQLEVSQREEIRRLHDPLQRYKDIIVAMAEHMYTNQPGTVYNISNISNNYASDPLIPSVPSDSGGAKDFLTVSTLKLDKHQLLEVMRASSTAPKVGAPAVLSLHQLLTSCLTANNMVATRHVMRLTKHLIWQEVRHTQATSMGGGPPSAAGSAGDGRPGSSASSVSGVSVSGADVVGVRYYLSQPLTIQVLVQSLGCGDMQAALYAACVIRGLSYRDPNTAQLLVEAGAVEQLALLLQGSENERLLSEVAGGLQNLSKAVSGSKERMSELGGLLVRLVQLLRHPSVHVAVKAAGCLRNLVRTATTQRRVAELGAVPALAALLRRADKDDTLVAHAVQILWDLSNSRSNVICVQILESGSLPALVGLLNHRNNIVANQAKACLSNLARSGPRETFNLNAITTEEMLRRVGDVMSPVALQALLLARAQKPFSSWLDVSSRLPTGVVGDGAEIVSLLIRRGAYVS